MTLGSFNDILKAYSDKNPYIAVQEITSSEYEKLLYACAVSILYEDPSNEKPETAIVLPRSRYNFNIITSNFVLNTVSDTEINDINRNSNIILYVNGNLLNISGMRYDAENNIIIFYYEQMYITT